MKKILTLILFTAVLALLRAQTGDARRSQVSLVITGVTVVNVAAADPTDALRAAQTIVIVGNRIAALGKSNQIKVPEGARVIDATGKFLIPGLWDMHVHVSGEGAAELSFPLFIVNGVTGVRDMGGASADLGRLAQLRKEIARESRLGPCIVAAGPYLDGPRPGKTGHLSLFTTDEARQAVDSVKKQGWDFVKVHDWLSPTVYKAIAAEAKRLGLPIAGHVPISLSATEVSAAGQKSIEHLGNVLGGGLLVDCSTDEAALRAKMREGVMKQDEQCLINTLRAPSVTRLLATYSAQKAERLAALLTRNGTWQVPTIYGTLWSNAFELDDSLHVNSAIVSDPRMKYLPASARPSSDSNKDPNPEHFTAEDVAAWKKQYRKQLELIRILRRGGVQFMTGSDAEPMEGTIPGFSLQDELSFFVDAGFTPMEALQAATRNPAKYLGLLDSLGSVERGKIADLVLLDANPLDDIRNTQKISAVIVNGRLLDRKVLDGLLAQVEETAKSK